MLVFVNGFDIPLHKHTAATCNIAQVLICLRGDTICQRCLGVISLLQAEKKTQASVCAGHDPIRCAVRICKCTVMWVCLCMYVCFSLSSFKYIAGVWQPLSSRRKNTYGVYQVNICMQICEEICCVVLLWGLQEILTRSEVKKLDPKGPLSPKGPSPNLTS